MSEKLKALLNESSVQEPVYGVGGVLARSFRQILLARKIGVEQWNVLMDRFIRSELQHVEHSDEVAYTSLRGNLTNELTRPTMTWAVYMKGLRMLGFTTIDFAVMGSGDDFKLDPVATRVQMNSLSANKEADGE